MADKRMADLRQTAVSPHTMQGAPAQAPRGLAATALDPLRRAYEAYQAYIGQPFQQAVRGGVRGYFGLPLMSDASATGREAYRQGEALGYTPGVGMPAGAVRLAAEGVQALPSVAGEIGRVISAMPSGAARAQAEDFARYQRSIPPTDVSRMVGPLGYKEKLQEATDMALGKKLPQFDANDNLIRIPGVSEISGGPGFLGAPPVWQLDRNVDGGTIRFTAGIQPPAVGEDVGTMSWAMEALGDPKRGTGAATEMFLEVLAIAQKSGAKYRSDSVMSDASYALHERLKRAGVKFGKDGNAYTLDEDQLANLNLPAIAEKIAQNAKNK